MVRGGTAQGAFSIQSRHSTRYVRTVLRSVHCPAFFHRSSSRTLSDLIVLSSSYLKSLTPSCFLYVAINKLQSPACATTIRVKTG